MPPIETYSVATKYREGRRVVAKSAETVAAQVHYVHHQVAELGGRVISEIVTPELLTDRGFGDSGPTRPKPWLSPQILITADIPDTADGIYRTVSPLYPPHLPESMDGYEPSAE